MSKHQKLKSRVFINYLIDYDSINIYRIWNSNKRIISDYRDVIFDETQYYDNYSKENLITETKKKLVRLIIYESKISMIMNEDEETWLDLSIKRRTIQLLSSVSSSIVDILTVLFNSLFQLSTSTSTRYTDSSTTHIEDKDLILSQNVIQRRFKKKKLTTKIVKLKTLFEIDCISLDIIEKTNSKSIISTNLNIVNIIEEKRSRKSNSRFAKQNVMWSVEKRQKLSFVHFTFVEFSAVFLIDMKSNQSSFDTTSSFEVSTASVTVE